MGLDVLLECAPIAFVVADLLAGGADGEDAAQRPYLGEAVFQRAALDVEFAILMEQGQVALNNILELDEECLGRWPEPVLLGVQDTDGADLSPV